jgi:probable rRNA maturation factor
MSVRRSRQAGASAAGVVVSAQEQESGKRTPAFLRPRRLLVRNACRGLRPRRADLVRMFRVLDASRRFRAPAGELSIVLLDLPAMGRLHERFMGDPDPTDVITFEGDPSAGTAGEICVCADVAREYAAAHGGDFAGELALYLVHGYLHLSGYDDHTAAQRKAMRRAERTAFEILRAGDAVPVFRFD